MKATTMIFSTAASSVRLGLFALALSGMSALSATSSTTAAEKEREYITVLQSSASPAEKAITCKRLAVYGSPAAVPALAPLLLDRELASWARIALEVIPGPQADEALRQALDKTQGLLLIGTINSVAVRRDAQAVPKLEAKLKDSDPEVASAAAVALGCIGGPGPAKILRNALTTAPPQVRGAVAEGCVRCAELFLVAGKASDAVKLYDAVRKADVPKQKLLEATRGAILARKSAGIQLLVEQLHSSDKAFFGIGLTTARELPGAKATKAVEAELLKASPERQPALLLALAGRNDPAALPAILNAARTGTKPLRLTAVNVLDQWGKPASVPVLMEVAAESDSDLTSAALAALTRMSGTEVDSAVLNRLQSAQGKNLKVAIELAGRRRVESALPAIMTRAQDPDSGIRSAAVQALADVGGEAQVADLVKLLQQAKDSKDRAQVEAALLSISSRVGPGCSRSLQALARSEDPSLRITALHALASAGGADALVTVNAAVGDKDETVQDEAVRTLANWPNTWPEDEAVTEPLLKVAQSDSKLSHQVLASRGYLQFLEGDKKLKSDAKLAKVKEILPLLKRTEEKQLAIAVLHGAPSSEGLVLLVAFAGEENVAEDACSALVDVAGKNNTGLSKEERQKVLKTALEKSTSDTTKRKAEAALKKLE